MTDTVQRPQRHLAAVPDSWGIDLLESRQRSGDLPMTVTPLTTGVPTAHQLVVLARLRRMTNLRNEYLDAAAAAKESADVVTAYIEEDVAEARELGCTDLQIAEVQNS